MAVGDKHEGQYTSSALGAIDDAEGLSLVVQAEYSRRGWENWGVLKAEEQIKQRSRTESNQLREVTNKALKKDRDPTKLLDRIKQAREEFERELERAA